MGVPFITNVKNSMDLNALTVIFLRFATYSFLALFEYRWICILNFQKSINLKYTYPL